METIKITVAKDPSWARHLAHLSRGLAICAVGALTATVMSFTHAQTYPSHPIQLILPSPPGGLADLNARPVARYLTDVLGQPVVVVNRPGAGGAIAYNSVAKAKPDGQTVLLGLSTISVLPEADRVNGRVPSYELDQLVPVALLSAEPLMLLVRSDAPWKTVNDLIEDARRHPGKITYSSSGNYGAIHFPMELMAKAVDVNMLHVPYKGGGPAQMALLSGEVDVTGVGPAAAKAAVAGGKTRILAHWGSQRNSLFPEVPTLKERGIDAEYHLWIGLFVPAGTPAPVVNTLRAAVRQVVSSPNYKADMENIGIPIHYLDGPEFGAYWKKDADKLIDLTRKIGRVQ